MDFQLAEELSQRDQKKLYKKIYDNLIAEINNFKIHDRSFFEKKKILETVELGYKNRYEKSDIMIH